jgi:hypothetical protein
MQYGRSLGRGQVLNPFDGGEDATRLAVAGRAPTLLWCGGQNRALS